jgi:hypothetical protein
MAKKPPRRKHSVAELRANPKWRRYLKDAQLTPAQRAQRTRNTALKADPLAPIPTLGGLEGQANTLVDAQQAGDVAGIKAEQSQADAEFGTRSGMYRGLANFQTAGAQNAFNNVTNSVNSIIAANNAGSAADTSMLSAALKKADDEQRAAYGQMGVAPAQPGQGGAAPLPGQVPQDVTADRLAALAGTEEGVRQQLGQSGVSAVAAEAGMGAIPGQGLAINLMNLTGERNETNKQIQTKRDTLQKDRKGLFRQAVRDLQDFELAKRTFGSQEANQKFQQYMAEKEFDEKVKQESFAEWLQTSQLTGTTAPGGPIPAGGSTIPGRAQSTADRVAGAQITGRDPRTGRETVDARNARLTRNIDWFNAHTNRTQAEAAITAALREAETTKDDAKSKAAEQRATRIASGIAALNSFLAPNAGEGAPPSATSRYPVGTSTAVTDKNGNPITHKASQAEADAYNKAHQNTGQPPLVAGDPVPTTGKPYVRRFNDALSYLKSQGLSHSDALRILSMSTYTDWKSKARGMLSRMKRRQRGERAPEPKKPKPKPKRKPKGAAGAIPGFGDVPQ